MNQIGRTVQRRPKATAGALNMSSPPEQSLEAPDSPQLPADNLMEFPSKESSSQIDPADYQLSPELVSQPSPITIKHPG